MIHKFWKFVCWLLGSHLPTSRVRLVNVPGEWSGHVETFIECERCGLPIEEWE